MEIIVTAITVESTGMEFTESMNELQDMLSHTLLRNDYGGDVERFAAYFVAVDSDPTENARFGKGVNGFRKLKNPLSGESVRTMEIAVFVDPELIIGTTGTHLRLLLRDLLLQALESPLYKFPRNFKHNAFLVDVKSALAPLST